MWCHATKLSSVPRWLCCQVVHNFMNQTSRFVSHVYSKIHCLCYGCSVVKLSFRESRQPSPVLVKKMKTNNTTKFKSWGLRDTTVDTESVLTCLYTANFIPVLKIERIRAVFEFIKKLGPVVRRPISAYPGLNFNPGLFFFSSKPFSRTIFSITFRVANHQKKKKKNDTEFAF